MADKSGTQLLREWKRGEKFKAMAIEVHNSPAKAFMRQRMMELWEPLVNKAARRARRIAQKKVPVDTGELKKSIEFFPDDGGGGSGWSGMNRRDVRKRAAVYVQLTRDEKGVKKFWAVEKGRKPPEAGGWRRMDKQPFWGVSMTEAFKIYNKEFRAATHRAIREAYQRAKSVPDKPVSKL